MKRIIYSTDTGGVAVIIPTGELPLEVVARKDVPQGVPYKIIDTADVPTDRTFRAAWKAEISKPDGVGDPAGYWLERAAAEKAEQEAHQAAMEARMKARNEAQQ